MWVKFVDFIISVQGVTVDLELEPFNSVIMSNLRGVSVYSVPEINAQCKIQFLVPFIFSFRQVNSKCEMFPSGI